MSLTSPKFFLREKVITKIVNEKRLKNTWKTKTHTDFRQFPIADPVDYLDVNRRIDDICKKITTQIRSGEYSVSRVKRYLSEKSRGLCRQMTIPSVEDALTLQCLADAFWQEIKSKAPSKNAFFEPKDHSFSKTDDDEPEYGSVKAWLDFQKKILGFSKENNFIVITDVANYYDFIDFSHLRNVIVSTVNIQEAVIDFLMYMLSGMCWRPDYMPTRDVGMPQMDIDAPRLLAHCFLFELDAVVEDMNFANYTRFMDDIDAGANNIADAKKIIKSIDLTLQTRQLRLNAGKTRIFTSREARSHFKILENRMLKEFEKGVMKSDRPKAAEILHKLLERWNKRRVFDEGNGEKILKRILSFATTIAAPLNKKIIFDAIRLRPNLRGSAFRYLAHCGYVADDIKAINKIIADGYVCDDIFYMEYCRSLATANIAADVETKAAIQQTIHLIEAPDFYRLHGAIILASRFMKADALLDMVRKHLDFWRHDHHLGRLVGGLSPIARRDKKYQEFTKIVADSLNPEALSIQNFHFHVRTAPSLDGTILNKFLKKDDSFPVGIRYGKWMLLHSILDNEAIPPKKMAKIKSCFAHLNSAPYFSVPGL
jgi:hypothetical protein